MAESDNLPTLEDVAREAGVSLATASRVLNGSERRVADSYREKVTAAAARVGYSANLSAQAMARGALRTVALLVSDIADPFFSTIAAGVADAAGQAGLLVTMAVTGRDPVRELELVRVMRGLRPQVIVLVGSRSFDQADRHELIDELAAYRRTGGRVALVGRRESGFSSVGVDDAAAAGELATALAGEGLRRFAVLAGPVELAVAGDRVAGFERALAERGIAVDPSLVLRCDFTRDGAYRATAQLIAKGIDAVDAIFAANDVMAIGALAALREAGIGVPEQIAVAGFDDIPTARDTNPTLTTVRIPLEELGRKALELALAEDTTPSLVATEVVLRESTGRH